jgi:hypothetical protein
MQRGGEAIDVVGPLPQAEGTRGRGKAVKALATPKLLAVNAVAALDLTVLLGAAGLDVAMMNSGLLDREREGRRELGAVVALQAADGEWEGPAQLGEEVEARALVELAIEPKDSEPGAVIEGRCTGTPSGR